MEIDWRIEEADVEVVRHLCETMTNDQLVQERVRRNVTDEARPDLSREHLWYALTACLLTSQQRSGPDSAVNRFLRTQPFPLSLDACRHAPNLQALAVEALNGLRFSKKISRQLDENFVWLEACGWNKLIAILSPLKNPSDARLERDAARELSPLVKGFGPKQARNFMQMLGLTRFEIPLDSRIIRWLNQHDFPVHLSTPGLSDQDYYEFVMNGVQELCVAADVLPCIFDASVFASYDKGGWSSDKLMWSQ